MTQWVEFTNAEDIALAAADTIEEHARFAIGQRGEYKLVLAGGSTPVACYQLLAKRNLQWDRWKLFYGDERCLAENDADRNSMMVEQTGLTKKIRQHFKIPSELGAIKGAALYRATIAGQMPFDTVLLGMGEDGHTASLFPGYDWLEAGADETVVAVRHAPKPPPDRISLTPLALQNCRQLLLLISGDAKYAAVQRWQQGEDLPVARVAQGDHATVFIEAKLTR